MLTHYINIMPYCLQCYGQNRHSPSCPNLKNIKLGSLKNCHICNLPITSQFHNCPKRK